MKICQPYFYGQSFYHDAEDVILNTNTIYCIVIYFYKNVHFFLLLLLYYTKASKA